MHNSPVRTGRREEWIRNLPQVNEQQEDALAPVFDARWGDIEATHREFVDRFLAELPPDGRVLDAACGTGKYFPLVLASGRSLLGVDHSGAYLANAGAKFPQVPTAKHDLQDLPYEHEFEGVMCIDAMEFVPPEDWPRILAHFRRALRPAGRLYLTVELHPGRQVRELNEVARRSGFPVVEGEILWDGPEGLLYHHYPTLERVRAWLVDTGFVIDGEAEEPWHKDYSYHHVLVRLATRRA
jgi:SAM-dependent methyltransferase